MTAEPHTHRQDTRAKEPGVPEQLTFSQEGSVQKLVVELQQPNLTLRHVTVLNASEE